MRVFLYELPARRDIVTHQHGERPFCLSGVVNRDFAQSSLLRIHCGVPELLVRHFTETFVPLDGNPLVGAMAKPLGRSRPLVVGLAIYFLLAFLHEIERRSSQINVSVLNKVEHVTEEER